MTRSAERQAGLNELAAALVERLEEAEYLAIRSMPTTSHAVRRHVTHLRQVTEDAATLAAAIAILVGQTNENAAQPR